MTKTTLARLAQLVRGLGLTVFTLSVFATGACVAEEAKPNVFGNPDIWHWPPTRTYHVENYRLTLQFDEAKGEVFGDETSLCGRLIDISASFIWIAPN